MAFEGLMEKLQGAFKKLSGHGKLTEREIRDAMREVRIALLEADVNYKVVKDFIKQVSDVAVGKEVLESLNPAQHVIKLVNEEMTRLMGSTHSRITYSSNPPTVLMLVGLQGTGKTTMAAKLAAHLQKTNGKKPMLAACDIYRPAAIEQLKVNAGKVGVNFFSMGQEDPVKIAQAAVKEARRVGCDLVILDTAGRLHIDEELMDELKRIKTAVRPQEILLLVDAMTGQDAVNVAQSFHEKLGIDGVILSKLDGDTRGGAALSVYAVTGKPIKFAGVGERLGDIEAFYPDRMASRILGMGDVLTLIEKAQEAVDEKKAAEMERKLRSQSFTLDDFLEQFHQIRQMGGVGEMLSKLPGGAKLSGVSVDEKQMARSEAIIRSMTRKERFNPDIINASRRKRIAAGSGTTVQQVNQLLKQYQMSKQMMKQFMGGGKNKRLNRMKLPFM